MELRPGLKKPRVELKRLGDVAAALNPITTVGFKGTGKLESLGSGGGG